jgi:carbamoyl-phosphate synthase large subunit
LTDFLENAIGCEPDAIADSEDAFRSSVMEHHQVRGIHFGDSAAPFHKNHSKEANQYIINAYTKKIAVDRMS